jgi:hypothetical protein
MAVNFNDILNKKADEIEKPPLPPQGTYRFTVTKVPEATESQSGEWDILNFQCQAVEAMDNVDMDDYKGEVTGIRLRKTYMFNKSDEVAFQQTEYNLRTFLEKHLGVFEDGMSMGEALNASKGAQFLGEVTWREDKREGYEGDFQADIGRTAPVE